MSETTLEDATEQQESLDDISRYLAQRLEDVQITYKKNKEIREYLDSFSSFLDQLYGDEARAKAILLVQEKHPYISREHIDKAIRTYETLKKYDKVAQLAKNAGIAEQLLAGYEHRGNFGQAAAVAKHLGLEDKATLFYNKAIIRCIKSNLFDDAGRLAQDAGFREKAQTLFTLARRKEKNISQKKIEFYEWFVQRGEDTSSIADRVVEVFEYTGRFEQAAEIAEKHGLLQKALENYEYAGQWARAGAIAEQSLALEKEFCHKEQYDLLFEKAMTNYSKAGWIDHAAKLALREGKKEKAICIYEDNHQPTKALVLAKEIGLQRVLLFYEKTGWYQDAMQEVKNTELSARESLYKALLTLSLYSFEVSSPELPSVPKRTYGEQKKSEVKEKKEEQILKNLPHLELKPFPVPKNGKWIELPQEDASYDSAFSSAPYSFPPYRQEDPTGWFLSRVGLNVVSSLTADTIKKYLPFLLTVLGISGSGYYATHHGQDREQSAASVSLNSNCPSKETKEGKFCRAYQWDSILTRAEKHYDLPEGLLAGLAMVESYGNPIELNIQNDGSAGMFQLEPEIAKKYGLVVYDEHHARTGNSSYGKSLRKFVEEKEHSPSQLQRYDDRFNVEKSATVAGEYLHDLSCAFKKQQRKDKHLASHDSWALAAAAYKEGKERAHTAVHDRDAYLLKVQEYQEYYVKRKKE